MGLSSAAATAFCMDKLEFNGQHLFFDGNQKITAANGTYEDPAPNAFSTVQVQDCPHRTPTCESTCYVHGLEKHANEIHQMYQHNSKTIREILSGPDRFGWVKTFATWIEENAQGGFRWHVSGDVFSLDYANFIRDVCLASPNVSHWIYTRSFPFVSPLTEASNLIVNLSADQDNYTAARTTAKRFGLRVCYLTIDGTVPDDLEEDDVIFPDYSLRGRDLDKPTEHTWWQGLPQVNRKMVCPVDFFGKSESIRCGVCVKCMVPADKAEDPTSKSLPLVP
jgi:hypothetical protein